MTLSKPCPRRSARRSSSVSEPSWRRSPEGGSRLGISGVTRGGSGRRGRRGPRADASRGGRGPSGGGARAPPGARGRRCCRSPSNHAPDIVVGPCFGLSQGRTDGAFGEKIEPRGPRSRARKVKKHRSPAIGPGARDAQAATKPPIGSPGGGTSPPRCHHAPAPRCCSPS